jgi:endonuclease G
LREEGTREYELHRNWVIAEFQGNRNPVIDRPDLARRVDFAGALALSN